MESQKVPGHELEELGVPPEAHAGPPGREQHRDVGPDDLPSAPQAQPPRHGKRGRDAPEEAREHLQPLGRRQLLVPAADAAQGRHQVDHGVVEIDDLVDALPIPRLPPRLAAPDTAAPQVHAELREAHRHVHALRPARDVHAPLLQVVGASLDDLADAVLEAAHLVLGVVAVDVAQDARVVGLGHGVQGDEAVVGEGVGAEVGVVVQHQLGRRVVEDDEAAVLAADGDELLPGEAAVQHLVEGEVVAPDLRIHEVLVGDALPLPLEAVGAIRCARGAAPPPKQHGDAHQEGQNRRQNGPSRSLGKELGHLAQGCAQRVAR
mmetsp:Transcript_94840/g.265574  ORF Transcript_94840/g.265574 Transcript_94840/m.265574 type:complete len:320 (-) Transcript_94840:31-990(-)